jgi:hypothetical protein
MKKLNLIIPAFLILLLLCACTSGSGKVKNAAEVNTHAKMSMLYDEFTGFKETKIQVDEGKTVVVSVNILTDSGSIDAYISKGETTEADYEGHDIPTSSFTVTLSEAGRYTIRVDADDHSGAIPSHGRKRTDILPPGKEAAKRAESGI